MKKSDCHEETKIIKEKEKVAKEKVNKFHELAFFNGLVYDNAVVYKHEELGGSIDMATKSATSKKETQKAVVPVVEEVKAEVKVEAAEKKEVAPAKTTKKAAAKTTTKATATKKTAEKETVAKTATKRTRKAAAATIYIQYHNQETAQEELVKRIIEKWCAENGKKESAIKEFDVYVKPEDNAAYYVVNGQGSSIELF